MSEPVRKSMIGLTDLAWSIAKDRATTDGCSSVSEWLEWIVLSQQFSAPEAASLVNLRRQRGSHRGGGVCVRFQRQCSEVPSMLATPDHPMDRTACFGILLQR